MNSPMHIAPNLWCQTDRKDATATDHKERAATFSTPKRHPLITDSYSRASRSVGRCEMQGCQMAIARFLDRMCLTLRASGLWLRYAMLQSLIPSFPWIAPPRPPP